MSILPAPNKENKLHLPDLHKLTRERNSSSKKHVNGDHLNNTLNSHTSASSNEDPLNQDPFKKPFIVQIYKAGE